MPRFLSTRPDASLIRLPWSTPLAQWPAELQVALPRGLSRHVVRFISVKGVIYAAKELGEELAQHEYHMLMQLAQLGQPAVEPVGIVTDRVDGRGRSLDPILLTRHLQFALPYRSLFLPGVRRDTAMRLLDALVVLIVRLHLAGFMWGDITLSNVLFRRDAEAFSAYLVDAETAEIHEQLTDGQRDSDMAGAVVNIYGDFLDLQMGGMLDPALDPPTMVDAISTRYRELWNELTAAERISGSDLDQIEHRVRRLNALGFDVAELDIETSDGEDCVIIRPKVVDAGHHSRRLMRLTGLDTEENQARRLLNDLDSYRARTGQRNVDESIVAHRWLTECFEPVIAGIPKDLHGKRDDAQIFHELLDYRWYQSQREARDVPLADALPGYIRDVLQRLPDEVLPSALAVPADQAEENLPDPEDTWEIPRIEVTPDGVLDRSMLLAKSKKK